MKILLFGKNGQVGRALHRSLACSWDVVALGRTDVDMSDSRALQLKVREVRPRVIINAAAYTAVDRAEQEPVLAHAVNATAPGILGAEAAELNALLVHYSTDYVFDGKLNRPYEENDCANPLSVYGASKLEGERLVASAGGRFLILRTSWVYSAYGNNFATTILRLAREREALRVVADQFGAPTSVDFIADVTTKLLSAVMSHNRTESVTGTYHLAEAGETSWYGYARFVIEKALSLGIHVKCLPEHVVPIATADYPLPARRPANSRLSTRKLGETFGIGFPHWSENLERMLEKLADERR